MGIARHPLSRGDGDMQPVGPSGSWASTLLVAAVASTSTSSVPNTSSQLVPTEPGVSFGHAGEEGNEGIDAAAAELPPPPPNTLAAMLGWSGVEVAQPLGEGQSSQLAPTEPKVSFGHAGEASSGCARAKSTARQAYEALRPSRWFSNHEAALATGGWGVVWNKINATPEGKGERRMLATLDAAKRDDRVLEEIHKVHVTPWLNGAARVREPLH
jgi:hypothetical protein